MHHLRAIPDGYLQEMLDLSEMQFEGARGLPACFHRLPMEDDANLASEHSMVHVADAAFTSFDDTNSVACDPPLRIFHDAPLVGDYEIQSQSQHLMNRGEFWGHTYPFWQWTTDANGEEPIRIDISFPRLPSFGILQSRRYVTPTCMQNDTHTSVNVRLPLVYRILNYQSYNRVFKKAVMKVACVGFSHCMEIPREVQLSADIPVIVPLHKPFRRGQVAIDTYMFQYVQKDNEILSCLSIHLQAPAPERWTQKAVGQNAIRFLHDAMEVLVEMKDQKMLRLQSNADIRIRLEETIYDFEGLMKACAPGESVVTKSQCAVM